MGTHMVCWTCQAFGQHFLFQLNGLVWWQPCTLNVNHPHWSIFMWDRYMVPPWENRVPVSPPPQHTNQHHLLQSSGHLLHCAPHIIIPSCNLTVHCDWQHKHFWHLSALPSYNSILISTVDILLKTNTDLHVIHIPGSQNVAADALSQYHNELATKLVDGLTICTFQPSWDVLGVIKK